MSELPAGATPIPLEEVFQVIGELYFQQRTYQRVIAQLQQQQRGQVEQLEHLNGVGAPP